LVKTWSSREIIRILRDDGWIEVGQEGSHKQFKHPMKIGKVTVPHPKRSLKPKTVRSILEQAGLL